MSAYRYVKRFVRKSSRDPLAIDEATAARLLAGMPADDAPPPYALLAEVLSAARAPATPAELDGEAFAVAAFARSAGTVDAPRTGDRWMTKRFALRALVSSVAGVLALGGVAAAAESGSLPGPAANALSNIGISVPNSHANQHAKDNAHQNSNSNDSSQGKGPDLSTNTGAAFGLCTAYLAHQATHGQSGDKAQGKGKWMDSTAFNALGKAAGGSLTGYCNSVIAAHQASQSPTGKPASPGKSGESHGSSANPHATATTTPRH